MKTKLLTIISVSLLFFFNGCDTSMKDSSMKDSRDGQTYKTVVIVDQEWMAENLNYETENSYCYNESIENCKKYGRLYTWKAALNACPEGWRLPTDADFETLISNVGGGSVAGKMLKSTTGWWDAEDEFGQVLDGNGIDKYGFNAIPAGLYGNNTFGSAGTLAFFWSATEYGEDFVCALSLQNGNEQASLLRFSKDDIVKSAAAYSVRCLRGSN